MKSPASALFSPLALTQIFNVDQQTLPDSLKPPIEPATITGQQVFQGIPFALGEPHQPNVILLDKTAVVLTVEDLSATYILFLHTVEDRKTNYQDAHLPGTKPRKVPSEETIANWQVNDPT